MAATPLFRVRGTLEDGWSLPGQDTSACLPPVALLDPPGASALGHAEPFGGRGASWKGAFVGGEHLVHAVTEGPSGEQLYGNFPAYQCHPPT